MIKHHKTSIKIFALKYLILNFFFFFDNKASQIFNQNKIAII